MSMYKVIPVGSWDFGMEPSAIMKVSSHGFSGQDRKDFFSKRAGSNMFADLVSKIAMGPGDIPIHTIAIGATERYGPNRNGDGFSLDTCRKHACSFESRPLRDYVKHAHNGARYFMHHKNDDPEKSFGYVKAAAFNEPMGRIELLIIGNGTKEAAHRNGGFVIPDEVLNELHSGNFVGGSMSCKIAHDVCQICNNKAASRKYYCDSDSCVSPDGTRGFGCKEGLTKLLKSGKQQFVENPNPIFFDFSYVSRPADRTAYGGIAREFLGKAASDNSIIKGGAWLAELNGMFADGIRTPSSDYNGRQLKLAKELADLERSLDSSENKYTKLAFSSAVQGAVDLRPMGEVGTQKFAGALRALANAGVILTPEDFLAVTAPSGMDQSAIKNAADQMRLALPFAFRKLAAREDLVELLEHPFAVSLTATPSLEQKRWAEKVAENRYCCECDLSKRASLAVLRGEKMPVNKPLSKQASEDNVVGQLTEKYALYQLATLAVNEKSQSVLTLCAVLEHNRC